MPAQVVGVVGGGPAGLATAEALDRAGIDFEVLERHNAIGGIWDINNPGSPMYESAHFISSSAFGLRGKGISKPNSPISAGSGFSLMP